MTRADMPALAQLLAMLAETFNEPVSELRAEGYYIALEDLPIESIQRGAKDALTLCKFFPKPIEIRDFVVGTPEERAHNEWDMLVSEVRRVGYIGTPGIVDQSTLEVIANTWGSWRRLCEVLPSDGAGLTACMKQFVRAYVVQDRPVGHQGTLSTAHSPLLIGNGDAD